MLEYSSKRKKAYTAKTTDLENLSKYIYDCNVGNYEKMEAELKEKNDELSKKSHFDAQYTPHEHILNFSSPSPNPNMGTNYGRHTFEFEPNDNTTDIFITVEANTKIILKYILKYEVKKVKKYAKEFLKNQE